MDCARKRLFRKGGRGRVLLDAEVRGREGRGAQAFPENRYTLYKKNPVQVIEEKTELSLLGLSRGGKNPSALLRYAG